MASSVAPLLSALGGGVVGALAVTLVGPKPSAPAAPAATTVAPTSVKAPPAVDAALAKRFDDLEARLELVEARAFAPGRQAGDAVTRADLDALRDELMAGASDTLPAAIRDRELDESIEAVVIDLQKRQAVERFEQGLEKERGTVDDRVAKYGDWLNLDAGQRDRMREILVDRGERDAEIVRLWAQGTDDETLGQMKVDNEVQIQSQIESILGPDQLDRYRSRNSGGGK
ncbi:MAG: hypothetical protein AAF726_08555 [Planctomycetota bacterium]